MRLPRQGRVPYVSALYHIMSRGDRREDLFEREADRCSVAFGQAAKRGGAMAGMASPAPGPRGRVGIERSRNIIRSR